MSKILYDQSFDMQQHLGNFTLFKNNTIKENMAIP